MHTGIKIFGTMYPKFYLKYAKIPLMRIRLMRSTLYTAIKYKMKWSWKSPEKKISRIRNHQIDGNHQKSANHQGWKFPEMGIIMQMKITKSGSCPTHGFHQGSLSTEWSHSQNGVHADLLTSHFFLLDTSSFWGRCMNKRLILMFSTLRTFHFF